jgi:hypothetical protein
MLFPLFSLCPCLLSRISFFFSLPLLKDVIPLKNGITYSFNLASGVWKDFSISVKFGSMLLIEYPLIPPNSDANLFVQYEGLGSAQSYLKRSTLGSNYIYIVEPDYGAYYLSLYCGNETRYFHLPFSITPFTGGLCGDKAGCLCPPERDDCSRKPLPFLLVLRTLFLILILFLPVPFVLVLSLCLFPLVQK